MKPLHLLIEFEKISEFQIRAHVNFDGDDLTICTVASQLIDNVDSINELRMMCLSIVQRYIVTHLDADVITVCRDQGDTNAKQ